MTTTCDQPAAPRVRSGYDPSAVRCAQWCKIWPEYRLSEFHGGPGPKGVGGPGGLGGPGGPAAPDGRRPCEVCGQPASTRCSGCLAVSYCTVEHQKQHWRKSHRLKCSPFRVETSSVVGRYLVATRDLKPGEVIFEERPIVVGPKQFTRPVCLECYKELSANLSEEDNDPSIVPCPECGWPMCGDTECLEARGQGQGQGQGRSLSVHGQLECQVLKRCKFKPKVKDYGADCPIYECITPLRCVLIKALVPANYSVLRRMEQHTVERRSDPFYPVNQTNTVNFMLDHMPDLSEKLSVTADEINAAVDVLDVNAFEIRSREFSIRGVFPLTALMNSVCSPNTQNCIGSSSDSYTCRVRAARPISKGQEITTSYTLTLMGTLFRRRQLSECKYFDCGCDRCKDPTEFGSHFSTLLCPHNQCRGFVTPLNSLDSTSNWTCTKCKQTSLPANDVTDLLSQLEAECERLPMEIAAFEAQIEKLAANQLHPNHYLILDLKFSLVQLYGRERVDEDQMVDEGIKKKALCEEVLSLLHQVIPGRFRLRGMLLYELYIVSLYLLRKEEQQSNRKRESCSGSTSGSGLARLRDLEPVLVECIEILSWEPEDTLEGQRCQVAREYLPRLRKMIKEGLPF